MRTTTPRTAPARTRRPGYRPQLTFLEDRCLLGETAFAALFGLSLGQADGLFAEPEAARAAERQDLPTVGSEGIAVVGPEQGSPAEVRAGAARVTQRQPAPEFHAAPTPRPAEAVLTALAGVLPTVRLASTSFVPTTRRLPTPAEAHPIRFTPTPLTDGWQNGSQGGGGILALTGPDSGKGVAVDPEGNAYVTGSLWNGADTDIFVAKVSPEGAILFAQSFPNPGPDSGNAIALDAFGNAYVTGSLTLAEDQTDAFVVLFDPEGTPLAANILTGILPATGNAIAVDADGRGYVTGAITLEDEDFFIARFEPDLAITSGFVYPNPGTDAGNGVALDAAFNAYVTGVFASGDDSYVYLAKFDADCFLLGGSYILAAGANGGNAIAVNADGNGYLTGFTAGAADSDFILARFNADLTFASSFVYPNPGADVGNGVVLDADFNAYVTGVFTFGPDSYVYVAKFDADLQTFLDSAFTPDAGANGGTAIAINPFNDLFVTGFTAAGGDYSSALVAAYNADLDPWFVTLLPNES